MRREEVITVFIKRTDEGPGEGGGTFEDDGGDVNH
jgi:hypothetical protein